MPERAHDTHRYLKAIKRTRRAGGGAALAIAVLAGLVLPGPPTAAQNAAPNLPRPPFTATLSNTTPLAFGMEADDAARALGTPLQYVNGKPGDEIYLTFRHIGGSGLFPRNDRLYLQFRKGRLTGWKGDWGHNWMWQ
jgi:hypothetical protein